MKIWVLFLFLSFVICNPAPAADLSKFPLGTFKNFERHEALPDKPNEVIYDAGLPAFSAVVQYTGNTRHLSSNKQEFLNHFSKILNNSDFFQRYEKEVEVVEQGRSYWIPVQKEVLPYLPKELKKGQEHTVYVRYFGVPFKDLERVYLMIDFIAEAKEKVKRLQCFTHTLLGVELGQDLNNAKKTLNRKFGKYVADPMIGQRKHFVYIIDRELKTQLIIGDAGAGFRSKVYSVQVSGPPNPNISLYQKVKLGSLPPEIEKILGPPVQRKETGNGFTQLSYQNTNCSVEIKNGTLASFLIAEDPNYFSD